ncbi:hypothetical protein Bca101_099494 [Brassica carinata]
MKTEAKTSPTEIEQTGLPREKEMTCRHRSQRPSILRRDTKPEPCLTATDIDLHQHALRVTGEPGKHGLSHCNSPPSRSDQVKWTTISLLLTPHASTFITREAIFDIMAPTIRSTHVETLTCLVIKSSCSVFRSVSQSPIFAKPKRHAVYTKIKDVYILMDNETSSIRQHRICSL